MYKSQARDENMNLIKFHTIGRQTPQIKCQQM